MSIREISAAAITDAVEALCIEANTQLPADVKAALDKAVAAGKGNAGFIAAKFVRCSGQRLAHLPGHRHGLRLY